jgi:hypothetical protein
MSRSARRWSVPLSLAGLGLLATGCGSIPGATAEESTVRLDSPTVVPVGEPTVPAGFELNFGPTDEEPVAASSESAGTIAAPTCTPLSDEAIGVLVSGVFEPSQVLRYRLVQTEERPGAEPRRMEADVTLTTIATDANGATLRWEPRIVSAEVGGEQLPDELLDEVAVMALYDLEYRTGPNGSYNSLLNSAAIREQLDAAIEQMVISSGLDDSQREQLERFVGSETYIQEFLAGDVKTFHSIMGVTLEIGRELNLDDAMANLLGGEPLPAKASMVVADPIDDGGCVAIRFDLELDIARLSPAYFAESAPALGPLEDLSSIEATTISDIRYDVGARRIVSIQLERRMSVNGVEGVDRRSFTLLPDA